MSSKVTGLDRLLRRFEELPKEIKDNVRDIVEETTLAIQEQAIRNAPAAGDQVRTTYGTQKINTGINQFIGSRISENGLAGEVFIEAGAGPLAIYIEFSTGVHAAGYIPTLDIEFQQIAQKYYINGKGTLIGQPFMLPAWFLHSPTVVPKISQSLKGLKL